MPALRRSVATATTSRDLDTDAVERAALDVVAWAHRANVPLVLAVSGGCDSMAMMHAISGAWHRQASTRAAPSRLAVLTFDHGTGASSTAAADLVVREATKLGLEAHIGRATLVGASEAEWRSARWAFFHQASPRHAVIATAHTRDDQIETVVMRAMRDAGARGLAALAARRHGVIRPFLGLSRESLRAYSNTRGVPFVEDPTNASRAYFRNRTRLDLLPAIRRVRPRFEGEMLALAERAATLRAEVDALALAFVSEDPDAGGIRVAREQLATYDSTTLCVLWPAIAARASVTLDRRGTLRLAQFTTSGAPGARMQLSGGVEVFRHRDSFVLRRVAPPPPMGGGIPLSGAVQFGEWLFRPVALSEYRGQRSSTETPDERQRVRAEEGWLCDLPADRPLAVRAWRPADRMRPREGEAARRVKRFFGDARIPGPRRGGWPVVLAGDEIVWIPGVRRSDAASERSGRPVIRYLCERFSGGLTNS